MRKTETEKAMRKEERYKGVLNWFKENVPVAETELHYDCLLYTSPSPRDA